MKSTELRIEELRIGNWIFEEGQDDNKPFQIFSIYHEVKNNKVNGLPICLMRPIPLTEDILLKCGFVKQDGDLELYLKPMLLSYDLKTNKMYLMAGQFAECTDTVPCEYLHQLQNLYFALTGEELNINLCS
jgi:hypothetical protein